MNEMYLIRRKYDTGLSATTQRNWSYMVKAVWKSQNLSWANTLNYSAIERLVRFNTKKDAETKLAELPDQYRYEIIKEKAVLSPSQWDFVSRLKMDTPQKIITVVMVFNIVGTIVFIHYGIFKPVV